MMYRSIYPNTILPDGVHGLSFIIPKYQNHYDSLESPNFDMVTFRLLSHMCKHSLFLINGMSNVLISMTKVRKTKVEFHAIFCKTYKM